MKSHLIIFLGIIFVIGCTQTDQLIDKEWHKDVLRVGMVVKVKTEKLEE